MLRALIVEGAAAARVDDDVKQRLRRLRIAELNVVLDTMTSVVFSQR